MFTIPSQVSPSITIYPRVTLSYLPWLFFSILCSFHTISEIPSHQDFKVFWSSQGLWFMLLKNFPKCPCFLSSYFWVANISKTSYFPILQFFQFNAVQLRPLINSSSNFLCWFHINKGIFFKKACYSQCPLVHLRCILSQGDTIKHDYFIQ